MGSQAKPVNAKVLPSILPEIRSMIDQSRRHVATTADLTLVNLCWNIGRVITQDILRNQRRAEYGSQLLKGLASELTKEYGRGYSKINLQDMRRFYEYFRIDQTLSDQSSQSRIDQTPSDELGREIRQTLSGKSTDERIPQTVSAESPERIRIDFKKHFRLGWSHYRLLLGQSDPLKRKFYFEQAATQRWSVRAFQRQIDGALFERVALSRNTASSPPSKRRKTLKR